MTHHQNDTKADRIVTLGSGLILNLRLLGAEEISAISNLDDAEALIMHLDIGLASIAAQIETYELTNTPSNPQWFSRLRAAQRAWQVRLDGAKSRASRLRQIEDRLQGTGFASKFVDAARRA